MTAIRVLITAILVLLTAKQVLIITLASWSRKEAGSLSGEFMEAWMNSSSRAAPCSLMPCSGPAPC